MKIKKSIKKSEITNYRRYLGSMRCLKALENPAYAEFERKTARARRTVNSIPDPALKLAAKLKWISPLGEDMKTPTWNDVAREMGDTMTGDALRVAVHRELDRIL